MPPIAVKAGTAYTGPFETVNVNSESPTVLESEDYKIQLVVRIKGVPAGEPAQSTSEAGKSAAAGPAAGSTNAPGDGALDKTYFADPPHTSDTFSIQFFVTFKNDVAGNKLLWGNDFDAPIRDILPWGFSAAFKAFKLAIDPSVDGDPYADKPYLYGPALCSINYIAKDSNHVPIEENVDGNGLAKARRSKYLSSSERDKFVFEKGHTYGFDFCTPYLEMSEKLAVHLPGFTFDVGRYANQTSLRYVLKNGDDLIFCVILKPSAAPDAASGAASGAASDSAATSSTTTSEPKTASAAEPKTASDSAAEPETK